VAECEQAAQLADRAELTSALTAIIDDATTLRWLYRPREWRTLDELVRAHRAAKDVPAVEKVAESRDNSDTRE
jgi:hypothetical protein